jgi:hypothetical protein
MIPKTLIAVAILIVVLVIVVVLQPSEFFKPFKATNIAEFTFKPEGDQTVVTWSMTGKNNFMFKAVGLFMNCDKIVGGMFEQGLANLKTIAEAEKG